MRLMKYIIMLLLAVTMLSCDHAQIDGCAMGSSLYIVLQNESGENLLDITEDNNLVGKFSGTVVCDGVTYDLDWSIMNDDMVGIFPLEEDRSLYDEYEEEIFKWNKKYICPGAIPPICTGFRYFFFALKESATYRSLPDSFIYFGDLDLHKDAKKKIKLSFPELGIEYDIVWKVKFNGTDTVIVNGEKQEGNTVYITLPELEYLGDVEPDK